jgi:hypothetical protein
VVLANESARRFHPKPLRPRSIQLMDDDFTAFADAFNLPVRRPQVANGETRHSDEHAGDHNRQSGNLWTPAFEDDNPEESSSTLQTPRRSNKVTFPRNNSSCTPEENHTSIHKEGLNGTSFFFSLGGFLLKRGGVGTHGQRLCCPGKTSGNVRETSLGSFLFLQAHG